ncbi:PREDICTED: F-box protein CPR30-like [Fragaria vesca subsp. vesca]|uniref:F-box protein CPR30-like n=1 Tax=Fragaria vesca subsp. vesca TaxID=101020 RepID=UPI0002C35547|nr:PREDICTED: F-box protein CPR30-like [Fragaria vesca subsp. vesca]
MVANATLPEELILQIVSRATVKTVGRCRCVSTVWRSLFSDPQFAKSHFQVSPKHQALIFLRDEKLKRVDFDLSNTASFEKESLVVRDLKAPFGHTWLRFLRSCNGLVALADFGQFLGKEESLFIWNPSTGFLKKLPSRRSNEKFIFGFGCASSSDEYKLLVGAKIFSFKTNSWKPIEMPPSCRRFDRGYGVLCRDALYWRPLYPVQGQDLYAFNLEKEEFSIMKLPEAFQTGRANSYSVIRDHRVTCDGCLFVMDETPVWDGGCAVEYHREFWVMREYGNSDSWTRSFGVKIPCPKQSGLRSSPLNFGAISVMETSAFVRNEAKEEEQKLMSTTYYRYEEENPHMYMIESGSCQKVVYEESLYCLA